MPKYSLARVNMAVLQSQRQFIQNLHKFMVSFLTFKNKNEEINIRILKLKIESEKMDT